MNYAESDAEEEDAVFKPLSGNGRAAKRRRISVKDESDDEFGFDAATQAAMEEEDDGMLSQLLAQVLYDRAEHLLGHRVGRKY